jgi:hypothetical protein
MVLSACLCLKSVKVRVLICTITQFFHYIEESVKSSSPTITSVVWATKYEFVTRDAESWIPKRLTVDNWGDNKVSNVVKIFMHVGERYELLPRGFCWICMCDWLMSPFAPQINIWMSFIVFGLGLTTEVSFFLIVVLPCMLTITQLLLQQNAHFYY